MILQLACGKWKNLQKQLKNRCIRLGNITAMVGERPLTCSIIALKMKPTAFIVPFVTKFEANPAIVTKLLAFCIANLSRQSTFSKGKSTRSLFKLPYLSKLFLSKPESKIQTYNVWPTDIVQTQNGPSAQTALDSQNGPSVHSSFVQNGPSVYSSCVQNGPSVHLACVPGSLSWGAILGLDNIGWSDVM